MKGRVDNPRRLETPLGKLFSLTQLALYEATKKDAGAAAWGASSYSAKVCKIGPEELRHTLSLYVPLLRCIFGNSFRSLVADVSWITSSVDSLAESIYTDRAFDRLPILADALEAAGCTNADILGHCRGPGPHVRGCWVVDLILGKT